MSYKLLLLVSNENSAVAVQLLQFETIAEADLAATAIQRYDESETYFQADAIKLYNLTK